MDQKDWYHWTVRSEYGTRPFYQAGVAADAWAWFKDAAPDARAAVLMPNHVHLLLPRADAPEFFGVLGALSRHHGIRWDRPRDPSPVAGRQHLVRSVRYTALNPTRAALTGDPASWRWSTYRDVVGASAKAWTGAALDSPNPGRRVQFHDYIMGDPSVDAAARARLRPEAKRSETPTFDLARIETAAAMALGRARGVGPGRGENDFFLWLARTVGWTNTAVLARHCGLSIRAVYKALYERASPDGLEAGLVLLGEPRFFARDPTPT
jgi:REP element-mobilizing transposase RayT